MEPTASSVRSSAGNHVLRKVLQVSERVIRSAVRAFVSIVEIVALYGKGR
jgi:hypothetical protein